MEWGPAEGGWRPLLPRTRLAAPDGYAAAVLTPKGRLIR